MSNDKVEQDLNALKESGYVERYERGPSGLWYVWLNDDTDAPLTLDADGVEDLSAMMW